MFSFLSLRACLFFLACLATLVALFYTMENWRGKRAWETCRHELEAKGVKMDWAAFIPAPVPDDQNVFKAPRIAEWFVKASRRSSFSNELAAMFSFENTNSIAEVRVVSPAASTAPAGADIVLEYNSTMPITANRSLLEDLQHALGRILGPSATNGPSGASLQGSQNYVFLAEPRDAGRTVHLVVRAEKAIDAADLARFLPGNLFATMAPGGGAARVVPDGTNSFRYVCAIRRTFPAAEYLACTDRAAAEVESVLEQALARPYARLEGDYDPGWVMPIPNFISIRTLAQILAQRAQCDLLLGRSEAAGRELTLLHRSCRLLEARPVTLVSAMIDVAVTGLYTSTLADGLRLHAWKEQELIALQRQLAEVDLLPLLIEALRTEQVSVCHGLETVRTSDLDTVFAFGPEKPNLWDKVRNPTYWLLRWMPRGWVYRNMAAIADGHQMVIETIDLTNQVVQPGKIDGVSREAIEMFTSSRPYTYLASHIVPNFSKAIQTTAHNQVLVRQALLACALERYRLAHLEYPQTLSALTPEFIDIVPLDIIHGLPMKYRRSSDGSFLLYSVGWNETDDGGVAGKSATEADWVWDGHIR